MNNIADGSCPDGIYCRPNNGYFGNIRIFEFPVHACKGRPTDLYSMDDITNIIIFSGDIHCRINHHDQYGNR